MGIYRLLFPALCSLALAPAVWASQEAEALIEAYGKSEVIELLLSRCYGEVTTNKPFPKQVYGRPPADRVDARTLAHDMIRCKFTASDADADLTAKAARLGRRPVSKVLGGRRHSSSSSRYRASTSSTSIQSRLKRLEQENARKKRRGEMRRAEGQRELERQRLEAMTAKEREAERRKRACEDARQRRDNYRKHAERIQSSSLRARYQEQIEAMQERVRANCKSVF